MSFLFQCRTRLCGWCNAKLAATVNKDGLFQCRTRLCGWCNTNGSHNLFEQIMVSMPHAALWVVQVIAASESSRMFCFNAARGFVGGATHRSQPLSPYGEKALLENLRKFESSDGKYVKHRFLFSCSLRRNPLRDQHLARP